MSDYGPPTQEQIQQFRGGQSRCAAWVATQSSPVSPTGPRPSNSRTNSHSSSHRSNSTRNSSRAPSLPPPPAGFKYAPANSPVVYKTQSSTYTVVPSGSRRYIINSPTPQSSHRPSSSRQYTYPNVTYQTTRPVTVSTNAYPPAPHSKTKSKPLIRRLFGLGDSPKKPESRQRRHSTGGSGSKISIVW